MNLFNKGFSWYLEKYVAFEQIIGEGNAVLGLLFSKSRQIITYTFIVSGVSVGAEQGFGMEIFTQLPGWLSWLKPIVYFIFQKAIFILPAIPIIELTKDFYLGRWSRKNKLWQMRQEWATKKGIDVIGKEVLDRLREVHKKQCPETKIPAKGYGYVEENDYVDDNN